MISTVVVYSWNSCWILYLPCWETQSFSHSSVQLLQQEWRYSHHPEKHWVAEHWTSWWWPGHWLECQNNWQLWPGWNLSLSHLAWWPVLQPLPLLFCSCIHYLSTVQIYLQSKQQSSTKENNYVIICILKRSQKLCSLCYRYCVSVTMLTMLGMFIGLPWKACWSKTKQWRKPSIRPKTYQNQPTMFSQIHWRPHFWRLLSTMASVTTGTVEKTKEPKADICAFKP